MPTKTSAETATKGTLRMLVCRRFESSEDPGMQFLAADGQPPYFTPAAEATDTDFGDDTVSPIPEWPDVTGLLLLEWEWVDEPPHEYGCTNYGKGAWRRPTMDDLKGLGVL